MKPLSTHPLRLLCGIALTMEVAFLTLHLARRDDEQVLLMLGAYLVCGASWGWLLYRGWRDQTNVVGGAHPTNSRRALIYVFVVGLVFRATLMPLAPAASQDVQRYLWEGLVQQAGYSPYELAPNAAELRPLAEKYAEIHGRINHPDLAAIYPPIAQLLFRANAILFGGTLLGWKFILLAFDLLLAGALLWFLQNERGAAVRALIGVWWCPLLLIECYEGGHLDLIGAALLALAVVALSRNRPWAAALALALAVNVKYLWPIVIGVFLLGSIGGWRKRGAFALLAVAAAAACWLPYWHGLPAAIATARLFAESWTFNDPVFEIIRRVPGPRWLPMAIVLATLCGAGAWLSRKSRGANLWHDAWLLSGTSLLLGPVAYPWYFLWIVPGLALRPPLWLILWAACVPALHVVDWQYVRSGTWDAMPWLWWLVDLGPACLLARAWWGRMKKSELRISN